MVAIEARNRVSISVHTAVSLELVAPAACSSSGRCFIPVPPAGASCPGVVSMAGESLSRASGSRRFFFEILYIKRARKVCTDLRAEKDKKNTHTIYLYKLIMEEMKTFIKVHSVCLEEGLLNEPTFPPLESCSDSAKDSVISLLPYEPDTSVKVFMKKGLLNWCLAFSIIW
jgi:hypothetical protein